MSSDSPIEYLKSIVDLKGYARSQAFVGYFDSNARNYDNVCLAISRFENLMGKELPKAYLTCSFATKINNAIRKSCDDLKNIRLIDKKFGNTEQIFSDSNEEEKALKVGMGRSGGERTL